MSEAFHFDRFQLLPEQRRLLADGVPVELGARALDLLCVLVERAGALVTKDELLDRVWPGLVVEEANLHVQVSSLRKVLGREAIATVPGRGYQFVRPLQAGRPAAAEPLPPGLPPLLGREAELRSLREQVRQAPLVTVTGAGGSGKTLLARHALHALTGWPAGGATWVDLLDVADPAAVPAAVAAALGFDAGAGTAPGLARALAGGSRLLVLDNAEHLLAAVTELVRALQAAVPELHVLVTSQAPLKLPQELRLPLRGLAVPAWPCSVEQARGHAAVALFAERARQVDRRFRLDEASVGDVVALCAALDGSALGLQFAASLLAMQPLAEVRRRLVHERLPADPLEAEPTSNVLRAALAWSHGLLDEAPRRVFRRLAVALGALPLSLIVQLAGDAELDATAVADALADLVDRSMVQPESVAGEALPRYRLLDAPRTLALEQLQASGEAPALRERLAQAAAALAREAHAELLHAGLLRSEAARRQAWPAAADIQAALHWALANDLVAAAALAQTSAGHQLPAAERLAAVERLVQGAAALAPQAAGDALLAAATLTKHSDLGRRHALMLQAAARYAEAGAPLDRFYALARAAEAAATHRMPALAEAPLAEARAIEDPAWSPGLRQVRAVAEAALVSAQGDFAAAVPAWRLALELGRGTGTPALSTLVSLADAELTVGEFEAAAEHLREAAELAERRGHQSDRWSFILANLAAARLMQGDLAGAREAATEAWPHARRIDADAWWADHLALLASREGRHVTAALLLGLADAGYARIKDGRHALEERHATAAAEASRKALGDARFEALRRAGGSAEWEARVQRAALAPQDEPGP